MKTLKSYSDFIDKNKQNPGLLAELSEEIAADYGYCTDVLIKLKVEKAAKWEKIKLSEEKPLSDKLTEMRWLQTDAGESELKMKYRMKALEKYLSAIKSHIFVLNTEQANQY